LIASRSTKLEQFIVILTSGTNKLLTLTEGQFLEKIHSHDLITDTFMTEKTTVHKKIIFL